MLISLALSTSGLSDFIAEDVTTTPAPSTFSALCPIVIVAPRSLSLFTVDDCPISEPLISYPILSNTSAIPLIPIPPIPTK